MQQCMSKIYPNSSDLHFQCVTVTLTVLQPACLRRGAELTVPGHMRSTQVAVP